MRPSIPWIGYAYEMMYHRKDLQEKGFDVKEFANVSSGLSSLQQNNYPLIIVQYRFNDIQGLELPKGVDTNDPTAITCSVIQSIREINTERSLDGLVNIVKELM